MGIYGSSVYGVGLYGADAISGLEPRSAYISWQQYTIDAGTLTIDSTIGKRSTASLTIHTINTSTHFRQYQPIQIYDSLGNLAFNGFLDQPIKEIKPGFQQSLEHQLTCCDMHWLADKRIVAASFTDKTCGSIAQWLVDNILVQEGVTVGAIYDGLTPSTILYPSSTLYPGGNVGLIPQATFAYCTVAQALDELVKQASAAGTPYYWMIDYNKQLWFVPYTYVLGPTIDGTTFDDGHLSGQAPYVQRQNPLLRNTQYEVGGYAQTSTQTEVRVGDGNTQSWDMGYPLASAPMISTNLNGAGYVAQSVGVQGIDTAKAFYYQLGSTTITQDSSGTKLRGPNSPVDLLQVAYVGQYPNVAVASNAPAINAQAWMDGTSGIVESVDNDPTLSSAPNALAKASALLTYYGVPGTIFVGNTLDNSYAPGQLVTLDLPMYGLSGAQGIVEQVSATDSVDGYNIWYTVTAVSGPYDTTWTDFFKSLFAQITAAADINAGTTQSLTLVETFIASAITPSATFTATVSPALIPSATTYPNTNLYPG